jgi:predicted Zn finger-like uncharacterized protein
MPTPAIEEVRVPIALTCSGCQASFKLKDDLAGHKVRCPHCEAILVVPLVEDCCESESRDPDLHWAFDRDRFLLRQKMMTIGEKYVVWDEAQRPILYIERPMHALRQIGALLGAAGTFVVIFFLLLVLGMSLQGRLDSSLLGGIIIVGGILGIVLTLVTAIVLSPKRHITFYADEQKSEPLLQILQDSKFQPITATYTLLTPEGTFLAKLKKNYLHNVIRKKWEVSDADGRLVVLAREDSLILSLLRRFLGPLFGFLRTNFILAVPDERGIERVRGEFNRNFTVFDRYVLNLEHDVPRQIDRRLAIALGVLLDTGERR